MNTSLRGAGAAMNQLIAGAGAPSAGDWPGRIFDRLDADGDSRITATEARGIAAARRAPMTADGNVTPEAMTDTPQTPTNARLAKRFESLAANGDGPALRAERELCAGIRLRDGAPDADGAPRRNKNAGWREG